MLRRLLFAFGVVLFGVGSLIELEAAHALSPQQLKFFTSKGAPGGGGGLTSTCINSTSGVKQNPTVACEITPPAVATGQPYTITSANLIFDEQFIAANGATVAWIGCTQQWYKGYTPGCDPDSITSSNSSVYPPFSGFGENNANYSNFDNSYPWIPGSPNANGGDPNGNFLVSGGPGVGILRAFTKPDTYQTGYSTADGAISTYPNAPYVCPPAGCYVQWYMKYPPNNSGVTGGPWFFPACESGGTTYATAHCTPPVGTNCSEMDPVAQGLESDATNTKMLAAMQPDTNINSGVNGGGNGTNISVSTSQVNLGFTVPFDFTLGYNTYGVLIVPGTDSNPSGTMNIFFDGVLMASFGGTTSTPPSPNSAAVGATTIGHGCSFGPILNWEADTGTNYGIAFTTAGMPSGGWEGDIADFQIYSLP